jgi:hypothetical protein
MDECEDDGDDGLTAEKKKVDSPGEWRRCEGNCVAKDVRSLSWGR